MLASLNDWLAHMERQHVKPIALGLDRLQHVKDALGFTQPMPVITVGGTNGKGSVCAILERILLVAGYRVGLYTSPHLLRYNERVRVGGTPASDDVLCEAFARVEAARRDTPLTYFEYGTLAAWHVFEAADLDVVILEVGLGGRLDAVNAFDADCAVITAVGIDHTEYLGDTREQIGREKAGIFRGGRPAIVGDTNPPHSVIEAAHACGANLWLIGRDFRFQAVDRSQWLWTGANGQRRALAYPGLRGSNQLPNAATALAALEMLQERLPLPMQAIRQGLLEVELPGRFQVLPGRPAVILDVAHNPHAAAVLASNLGEMAYHPETWAVFGMLRDKDIEGVVRQVAHRIDHWLIASIEGARGADVDALRVALRDAGVGTEAMAFDSPALAYAGARERAHQDDRILVFGSFLTVADVMRFVAGGG